MFLLTTHLNTTDNLLGLLTSELSPQKSVGGQVPYVDDACKKSGLNGPSRPHGSAAPAINTVYVSYLFTAGVICIF